jgi:hypothetical protein
MASTTTMYAAVMRAHDKVHATRIQLERAHGVAMSAVPHIAVLTLTTRQRTHDAAVSRYVDHLAVACHELEVTRARGNALPSLVRPAYDHIEAALVGQPRPPADSDMPVRADASDDDTDSLDGAGLFDLADTVPPDWSDDDVAPAQLQSQDELSATDSAGTPPGELDITIDVDDDAPRALPYSPAVVWNTVYAHRALAGKLRAVRDELLPDDGRAEYSHCTARTC